MKVHSAAAATRSATALGCALLAALATGCGRSASYELAPVSGVVTLDGKPVPHTKVVFTPQGSAGNVAPGPGSAANCDDAGRFELRTVRGEPGAVVGVHTVRIYAHGPPKSVAGDVDAGPPVKEAYPARYNTESQLAFEVPPAGTTAADFHLQSTAP